MNLKVYVLAIATFTVGLVELIIGGILPMIAGELDVSLSMAGQLITVFALVYAIAGPTLLTLTAKIERKRLYLMSMFIFTLGCLVAFWSPNYTVLLLSRVITASSGALITVLSLTIAVSIVSKEYRARVLGVILMGISSALVFGVPFGVLIGDVFGWRIIFLVIALLTVLAMMMIYFTLEKIPTEKVVPLREQLASLKNIKVMSAHVVTCLVFAGHYTFYAYFTPFLETMMNLEAVWISVAYLLFGVGAVFGGITGGWLADRLGIKRSILIIIGLFSIVMVLLPLSTGSFYLLSAALVSWGVLSWALSPPQQSYLIQIAPESGEFQQSVNYSFLQLGIALGSAIGGFVIGKSDSVATNALVAGGLIALAFLCAIFTLKRSTNSTT